jgi:hypothetical protein
MRGTGFGVVVVDAGLAIGAVLLTGGVLACYVGWKQRHRASRVADTPQSAVGDVCESGVVRVRGTVAPEMHGATFRSPVRDQPCVLAAWEIEENYRRETTDTRERSAWSVRSVPFYVGVVLLGASLVVGL